MKRMTDEHLDIYVLCRMIDVQISQLLQKQKGVYYEESLGASRFSGGEREPVVERGREKRVAIKIVGVFIWNPYMEQQNSMHM